MKKYQFRVRAKAIPPFCCALDRGKCCFNKSSIDGLCEHHKDLFSLLANGKPIEPNALFKIDYQIYMASNPTRCIIVEIDGQTKNKYHICENEPTEENLCERHLKILTLSNLLEEFKKFKLAEEPEAESND